MARHRDEAGLWLRRYHPAPAARVRLVCFPHAGGSATAYHAMSAALAPVAEVLAVQYPGRQDRHSEPCAGSLTELADRLAPLLAARLGGRPPALFGHSMGATVAYEVARRLERDGRSGPSVVFVSGRRAPQLARNEHVHLRDDRGILRELELLGGSAAEALADPELLRIVMPAIRGDYRASETHVHVPGPALRCPLVALTGDADPRAALPEVEEWRGCTEGPFTVRVFPGGHFYLHDQADAVHGAVREQLLSLPMEGAGAH
ncbi:alpha/beta fold hydrolase [Streptomyces sp. CAU 1734]|uniref:thioesterase II family protein n=1 Tax=Streptomyces sp. CAU 1734 TaxID=3140360 RepID=UPI003261B2FA